MTDPDLLVFGCVVTFIAAAGVYVFFRERYEAEGREELATQRVPVRREARRVA